MYDIDDLFNSRGVVGRKLEQIISAHKCTKSGVCSGAGISRPTLDKILNGEVTNKTNFEKHISKLLTYLALTPTELMGCIDNPFTDAKPLRKALNIDLQDLSRMSGVSIEELKKIEAGADAPLEILRDIACCLGTGVRGILGEGYFQTQIARLGYFVENDPTTIRSAGGFWGHLGIRVKGQSKYMWFPITAYTTNLIHQTIAKDSMAVPCMDNSLLLINCKNIEELVLLDEAMDAPGDMDWDPNVNCGEIPAVLYEAFDDYIAYKSSDDDLSEYGLSPALEAAIDKFISKQNIDPETFKYELHTATILFTSGRTKEYYLYDMNCENLADAVRHIYETGGLFDEEIIEFEDDNDAEILVNFKNISMMKLPLATIEAAIEEGRKKMMAEYEN